ncbi:putative anti-sigma regulatory factor, serine/threonine protein kinase [Kribbella flavida DSM 17836]|uniref:Putative anti-sigma regulatory factor, serine/threonine protein kinase n=1 Tax=Kribbella flavida (strain DSM 17836 / JCM 10339 / NBRC 14399) TaxID=479435 RepID=D2PM23_KRIFD|nr:sensor histidine kinase [Kribbella flavida]ADB34391.1 putative anti-sigma regulatory factor, serine/threonine protein kinase [Kribbella flavida DSM 17836]
MTTTATRPTTGFVHPALFYRTDQEYTDSLVQFITEGLALGQPVAVAVPESRLRLLREALGDAAADVTLINMEQAGRNPGRIIPTVLRRFADDHADTHVRIIGEPIWAGRSELEYPACAQHEALINLAFAGRDVTIVCPYDLSALDDRVVDDALLTHPVVWEGGRSYPSDKYAPEAIVARYNEPLDEPDKPGDVAVLPISKSIRLRDARKFAGEHAERLGLLGDRMADLQLIATELVANSIRHADGEGELRIWRDANHLVCEVSDSGRLTDPLAGRIPADPGQLNGRGLLLVNQMADLVRTHTDEHGTTVYAFIALDAPPLN